MNSELVGLDDYPYNDFLEPSRSEHGLLVSQELPNVCLVEYDDTTWVKFSRIECGTSSNTETLEAISSARMQYSSKSLIDRERGGYSLMAHLTYYTLLHLDVLAYPPLFYPSVL